MKTGNLLLAAVVSAGLTFGLAAQAGEHKSEVVDQKTLPAAVQKTITEKAAGERSSGCKGKTIRMANGIMRSL
jgi:hypothetical protein